MSTVGDRILNLRKELSLSQKELADKVGITEASLSRYENNKREPKGEIIAKLAKALNTTTDYLLGNIHNDDIYTAPLTEKDEKDVEKEIEKLRADISSMEGFMLCGEMLTDEAKEAILESLSSGIRYAKLINKKYTPVKYRKKNEDK